MLGPGGAGRAASAAIVVPPHIDEGQIAMSSPQASAIIAQATRSGATRWHRTISRIALNRDVLIPRPAGRFLFGRLIDRGDDKLQLLPPGAGAAADRRQSALARGREQTRAELIATLLIGNSTTSWCEFLPLSWLELCD